MEKDITDRTIIKKDEIDEFGIESYIDYYFDQKPIKSKKMIKQEDVLRIIIDCINKPKGVIPNSVFEFIPDFKI
jgi:hypothetical protein